MKKKIVKETIITRKLNFGENKMSNEEYFTIGMPPKNQKEATTGCRSFPYCMKKFSKKEMKKHSAFECIGCIFSYIEVQLMETVKCVDILKQKCSKDEIESIELSIKKIKSLRGVKSE